MKKSLLLSIGTLSVTAFVPLFAMAASDRYITPKTANAQCMQTVVMNRGTAMVSAFNAFNDAVTRALKDRAAAESDAWALTDVKAQEKALRDAAQTFDKAYGTAAKNLERTKQDIKLQYDKDARACKTKTVKDNGTGQICKPDEINGSRGAYFQCYDGAELKTSVATCQTTDSWDKIAENFCKGHCSKETGKCGVNTFAALDLCSRSCTTPTPTPEKKCVAYCPDGTPYNSCVQYFADPCMNHYGSSSSSSSSQQSTVSEQVTCYFGGSSSKQTCYGFDEKDGTITYTCTGLGSCTADAKGPKGALLTWKSSCGGYAYTVLDGTNEYAKFSCENGR